MNVLSFPPDDARRRTYTNPVYDGYFADPFVWKHAGVYYAVGTGRLEADGHAAARVFPLLRSDNLVDWRPVGGALERPDPALGRAIIEAFGTDLSGMADRVREGYLRRRDWETHQFVDQLVGLMCDVDEHTSRSACTLVYLWWHSFSNKNPDLLQSIVPRLFAATGPGSPILYC